MELVAEARNWWKLYSTQIMAVLAALAVIEGYFDVFKVFIPEGWLPYITALFALAAIVGRLIPQPGVVEEGIRKGHAAKIKEAGEDESA